METSRIVPFVLLLTACPVLVRGIWMEFNDTQYYYDKTSTTWYGARASCMQMGADLTSIHSRQEMDFIINLIDDIFSPSVWIGLNKLEGDFGWSDGDSLGDFSPWADDEPSEDNKFCVHMERYNSDWKWKTTNCGLTKEAYVCQRPTTSVTPTPKTDPTTPTVPGYCPAGYIDTGSKCYKLFSGSTAVTWEEALQACRSEPGRKPDLASFHSSRDNAFVTSQIAPKSKPMWIGSHKQGGEWAWTDNSDTNYKNIQQMSGDCLAMVGSGPEVPGTWNWQSCSESYGYICQTHKDPSSIISTPQPTPSHPCKEGFIRYGDGCYSYAEQAVTWSEADSTCAEKGSHLVAIHSEAENAAVQVLTGNSDVWIGLKKGGSDEYEWANGWYVLYTRWSASPQGDCVKMYAENGTWHGEDCSQKYPYICKVSTGPALTTPVPIEGRCPPEGDWVAHGSYCYMFQVSTVRSWYEAMEKCPTHYQRAQLVSVHHMVDNDWLYRQIKVACDSSPFCPPDMWIGLHKSQQDGALRWVDGSAVQFQHWAVGYPQDNHCAVMSKNHKSMWVDKKCEDQGAGYICKSPKIPLPTQPTEGPGSCPGEGWDSYGSSCFLYRPDEARRWFEAQELCLQNGGYLASILSDHENFYIHNMMMKNTHLPKNRPYWTGGLRLNSTLRFGWLGGASMVYSHWGQGYPKSNQEDCVQVMPDSSVWKNTDCKTRAGVVCRYDKVVFIPPPKEPGLSGGAIAGIVIGVLLLVGLSAAVVYLLYTRRRPPADPSFNNPLTPTDRNSNGQLQNQC